MAFSLDDIRLAQPKLPITVIYGPPAIGKTTFAAQAPSPVFIQCEEGQGGAENLMAFPSDQTRTYRGVLSAIEFLYTQEHTFRTVVIDTLSSLEPMVWEHTCQLGNKNSIEDFGYGKGYVETLTYWRDFVDGCKALRDKGMIVILLAHSQVTRIDPPDNDPYDRYQIKLDKRALAIIHEQSDIIGFANTKPHIKKTKDGLKEVRQAIDIEGRMLNLNDKPSFMAKNRYDLPDQTQFTKDSGWADFAAAINQHSPSIKLA